MIIYANIGIGIRQVGSLWFKIRLVGGDAAFDIFQSFQMKLMIFGVYSVHDCSIKAGDVPVHLL